MENMNQETERVAALHKYNILDTPPDVRFDRITRLAALATGTPLAFISFVDSNRIWYKSAYGTDTVKQTGYEPGFCVKTIHSEVCHIVENAPEDPDGCLNSFVKDALGVRSYAGMPLRSKSGYCLGALCIMDRHPRPFSEKDIGVLSDLSNLLMDLIELNDSVQSDAAEQQQILRKLAHDIRNPLTIVSLQAQILKMEPDLPEEAYEALNQIERAVKKTEATVYNLLTHKEFS